MTGSNIRGTSLRGWRVLVPRGGALGARLAGALTAAEAIPVIAPVIAFSEPANPVALTAACSRLSAGEYDWLVVTSATTVDFLVRAGVRLPRKTRVAAVGEGTRAALETAGFAVDFVPQTEHSAAGLVAEWPDKEWPDKQGRVLIPQSAIAEPTLAEGLIGLGLTVDTVAAYRTNAVALGGGIVREVTSGQIGAILLTSGSIAREVAAQCYPVPAQTVVVCIGESTAAAARKAGLSVAAVAATSSADSLVASLIAHAIAGNGERTASTHETLR